MPTHTVRRIWLSFVDRDQTPPFLGVAIVEITDEDIAEAQVALVNFPNHGPKADMVMAAVRKAKEMGCNPGGEVQANDITDVDDLPLMPLHRLMGVAELTQRGLIQRAQ